MRRAVALFGISLALSVPAAAQDTETLADIRQQLTVLNQEVRSLTRELSTTGAAQLGIEGTSFPDRVMALESQLQELTARTERLSARVETVSRDGGNRIEDLRFQLCELTSDCDISALPNPGPLGGAGDQGAAAPTAPPAGQGGGGQLAVGEQAEFDAARAALETGRNAEAAEAFGRFTATYPSGPLTDQARLLRAQALAADNQSGDAARAYLDIFSARPDGPQAAAALLGLGRALGSLGQIEEACLTLDEVGARFPSAPEASEAAAARTGLACP
ncbi:tetratricopeptide repeat protein [Jannaschia aquimarina]|uniref:Cell division coordinator CpoB n=1 Tax=Jannaschia aquimarina TaxID=935700 RepID=A0A0D1ECU1_9RHOB|nr:tetratricopeptide repeat protein [Jannaschia aquimarina]KIT15544.1 hypothetical protein jaqu_27920 [Jannaschia aquimarina]SNT34812.1 tol-pal system protein YbgF [Jannaschia aquimarina]